MSIACGQLASYRCREERDLHIHRVLSQVPGIAAACLRIWKGQGLVQPNLEKSFVANFLLMALGPESNMANNKKII